MWGSRLASAGSCSWHLLRIAVALDIYVVMLGAQNFSFGRPGAHFDSWGTPWETMGAAGRPRVVLEPDDGKLYSE